MLKDLQPLEAEWTGVVVNNTDRDPIPARTALDARVASRHPAMTLAYFLLNPG